MGETERYWAQVSVGTGDDCWPWTGIVDRDGYGMFSRNRLGRRAHRYAVELDRGAPELGKIVMHTCDNPPCVNPSHLLVGTQADNIADKMAKGRHRCDRGEDQGNAKLTEADVLSIRRLCAEGSLTQCEIGLNFGVDASHVSDIKRRKRWAWLKDA